MIPMRIDISGWRAAGAGLDCSFRHQVLALQDVMEREIAEGRMTDVPKSEEYGCHTYGREFTMPAGALVIGKIHRHPHLNFITKGKVVVATEFGREVYEAPVTFISRPGTKRAVYVLEECVWTTVHLTRCEGEENLGEIEQEVIAPSFECLEDVRSDPEMGRLIEEVLS